MCLIIYSPNGEAVPHHRFMEGAYDNGDGIGIMSVSGVRRFLGRKAARRAYRYTASLAESREPFAVHFRWATHGRVCPENTHPFAIPGSPYLMMHNGVLWTASLATEAESDTAIFAKDIMPSYVPALDGAEGASALQEQLAYEAQGSKLLFLNTESGKFSIVNERAGLWYEGLWYSNDYSIPELYVPIRTSAAAPATTSFKSSLRQSIVGAYSRSLDRPAPSGPTLGRAPADEDDSYDAWFYRARMRELTGRPRGFDWQDRSTWDQYPIPGSWDDLHRENARDGEDDLRTGQDGVQQYI